VIILIICLVCIVFSAFSYFYFDIPIARFCNSLDKNFLHTFFEFITKFGDSKWYLIVSFIGILFFSFVSKDIITCKQCVFFFLAGLLVVGLKHTFARARPKIYFSQQIYGFRLFDEKRCYNSFPSGHEAVSFSIALAIHYISKKHFHTTLCFLGAILIALSRLILTAHYLSDVLSGALIGLLVTYFLSRHFANNILKLKLTESQ
jgi:membrane-associated phospholipid phosphatase